MLWSPGGAWGETLLERGAYLMNGIVACGNCHTPQTPQGPAPGRELAGGNPINDQAFEVQGPNLTPDPESGLGSWSDDQIKTVITTGVRPDGSRLLPPMAIHYYANIRADDLDALVAYLRSLAPLDNLVR